MVAAWQVRVVAATRQAQLLAGRRAHLLALQLALRPVPRATALLQQADCLGAVVAAAAVVAG